MVWGLFPIDSLPGGHKYYIFSKGTYKVGRKDCDVIIQTDRAVSRVHAEIIVDAMVPQGPSHNRSFSNLPNIRIKDHSKFGTFINKELGNKPVHSSQNKESILKDGDMVSFGTGNAIFRFCFVSFKIFVHSSELFPSLQDTISSIGACTTHNWSPECTHVLVDESSPVTADLVDAIMAERPIVLGSWFMILAEKNIRTEIPSWSLYIPTLTLDGSFVKIVEPKAREKCLDGYTFVLGSPDLYKFGDKLPSLLQAVGGKVLHADEFSSNRQSSADEGNNQVVLVFPSESINEFHCFNNLTSLSRVTDVKLVVAVLSGHWESSMMEPPSIIVSSSHSTDETMVAESDVEVDTATSNRVCAASKVENTIQDEDKEDNVKFKNKEEMHGSEAGIQSEKTTLPSSKVEDGDIIERRDKGDDSEAGSHQNSDVIYSQDLIVRNIITPTLRSASRKKVVNFKCFRKRDIVSGNSFKNLIPFSKDPYNESEYGNKENAEYMREERKRKQMEAIAEDLFNNEKAKKRGTAGSSLLAFLPRP